MDFVYYPETDDSDFYAKINTKQEFYANRYTRRHLEQTTDQVCNPTQFNLQPHQIFVRNYLSGETTYNGLLIWHGVGSGKSCSAIQIAEGMKDSVNKLGKKIYIIASQQIQPNFHKELYSFAREQQELVPGTMQCTGLNYYIPKELEKDQNRRERMVQKRIKENYQFFGVRSFVNHVDCEVKRDYAQVSQVFDHSVIIIDEAHGITGEVKLKEGKCNPKRKESDRGILNVLHEILSTSTGTKLVLLSATPMKDNEMELVDLLDLLLINDGRAIIDRSKLFPRVNKVDREYLAQMARGYISYFRGENPVSFPKMLFPKSTQLQSMIKAPQIYQPQPKYNRKGIAISSQALIKHTKLIRCPMSIFQYANLLRILGRMQRKDSPESVGRQASNIIFPISSNVFIGGAGNNGFRFAFELIKPNKITVGRTKKGKPIEWQAPDRYQYQSFNQDFLQIDQIGKYSMKLRVYLHNLIHSRGTTYTYTEFVSTGARLIGLLLEANGYQRYQPAKMYGVPSLLDTPVKSEDRRCAICGQQRKAPIHQGPHEFKQAKYLLFTHAESKGISDQIAIFNDFSNQDGSIIKHIIGTSASSEGIDYKRIRQVHIIDPWHNATRLHQAIGRAFRHCSHHDLPESERTVTVFNYCSALPQLTPEIEQKLQSLHKLHPELLQQIPPAQLKQLIAQGSYSSSLMTLEIETLSSDSYQGITWKHLLTETPDETVYRRAERKDLFIKSIERTLKSVAIDCALNKLANQHPDDQDGSRECDYQSCDYQCMNELDSDPEINYDTYQLYFSEPQIQRAIRTIYQLFRYHHVFDLTNLIKLVQRYQSDLEVEFIYEALHRIIGHPPEIAPLTLVDRFGRSGFIIYKHPYYIFQPDELEDQQAPLWYRTHPITIKRSYLPLDQLESRTLNQIEQLRKKTQVVQVKPKPTLLIKPKKIKKIPEPKPSIRLKPILRPKIKKPEPTTKTIDADILRIIEQLKTKTRYQIYYQLDRLGTKKQAQIYETVRLLNLPTLEQHLTNLYRKRNVLYTQFIDGQPIWSAHRIDTQIRLLEQNTWITVTVDHPQITRIMAQMRARGLLGIGEIRAKPEQSTPYGFMGHNRAKTKLLFKLVDTRTQKARKKIEGKTIDKRTKVRGKACTSFKVGELEAYTQQLEPNEVVREQQLQQLANTMGKNVSKDVYCLWIELKLRELEDQSDQMMYYFAIIQ